MQLVHRIRRIRNQLAQENLAVRVDRVDHQIEQLLCLRLKLKCFLCHSIVLSLYLLFYVCNFKTVIYFTPKMTKSQIYVLYPYREAMTSSINVSQRPQIISGA